MKKINGALRVTGAVMSMVVEERCLGSRVQGRVRH